MGVACGPPPPPPQEETNTSANAMNIRLAHRDRNELIIFVVPHLEYSCGSPAVLGSFGESSLASRRKRGPVTFRLCLWSGLPLSDVTTFYVGTTEWGQYADVPTLR